MPKRILINAIEKVDTVSPSLIQRKGKGRRREGRDIGEN